MEPNLLKNTKIVYKEELYKDDIKAINDTIKIINGTAIAPKLKQVILEDMNTKMLALMQCHLTLPQIQRIPKLKSILNKRATAYRLDGARLRSY